MLDIRNGFRAVDDFKNGVKRLVVWRFWMDHEFDTPNPIIDVVVFGGPSLVDVV